MKRLKIIKIKKIIILILRKNMRYFYKKEEKNNREHISIEHQFRIQCEKFAQELDNLEDEKIVLLLQMVRIFYFI